MPEELNNTPKEVDVFKKYTKNNKFIVIVIAILIASIIFTGLYFFIKSLLTYTVTYELNGGYMYGSQSTTEEYGFLDRVYTPFAKKRGFYLEGWCKDEELEKPFVEGSRIWSDMTLYANWQKGVAIRLNFAPGEENEDLSLDMLRVKYEQYVKEGESWTLPLVYNDNPNSVHYGEQLLWYYDEACTDHPFETDTYIVTEDIDIYGKWFDTKEEKFDIENGTLNYYLGRCRNIILPNTIERIRSIDYDVFELGFSDQQFGKDKHSVFMNVMDANPRTSLNIIYLNENLKEIGECAFRACRSLNSVYFYGNKVETIGKAAFENCDALVNIELPSSVTEIPDSCFKYAFDENSEKAVIKIGSNIATIGYQAFFDSNLHGVIIEGDTFIDKTAFENCGELRYMEIKSDSVLQSNATDGYSLFESGTYVEPSQYVETPKFVIYVLPEMLEAYKTTNPWAKYYKVIKTK